MKIEMKNIGKVSEASIEIDSISLIAGINNSGKSTTGKVLYAISSSLNLMQRGLLVENKYKAIQNEVDSLSRWIPRPSQKNKDKIIVSERIEFNKYRQENNALMRQIKETESPEELDWLEAELNKITVDLLVTVQEICLEDEITKNARNNIEKNLENIRLRLEYSNEEIEVKASVIEEILSAEFSNDLTSKYNPCIKSKITLYEDNGDIIDLNIEKNKIISSESRIETSRKYSKSFYIDNLFIFDEPSENSYPSFSVSKVATSYKHRKNLIHSINVADYKNYMDEIFQLKEIERIFSKVLEGEIKQKTDRYEYVDPKLEKPLNFESLSTGMKSFSILRMLMEKGLLNNCEYLILDEPEIHLHPSWQLKYAEVIVLISKHYPVRILITSHSHYFIEAIDLYSRKHGNSEGIRFYRAENNEDTTVFIREVTENLERIYKDMYTPLNELEDLREDLDEDE